jgi:putative phosphonate metabolism protein
LSSAADIRVPDLAAMTPRYAIYYTPPPSSALGRFGAGVIGYDCFEAVDVAHVRVPGIDPNLLKLITVEPRRYGFHATLVAPFRLGAGTEEALIEAVGNHASRIQPVPLGRLAVSSLGEFVALTPATGYEAVARLAAECVEVFAAFRAPMTPEERERRMKASLTPHQIELMDRWGYPYVMDEFRFHMTLTGALPREQIDDVELALENAFEDRASDTIEVESLSVMKQDDSGARFRVLRRCRLRG